MFWFTERYVLLFSLCLFSTGRKQSRLPKCIVDVFTENRKVENTKTVHQKIFQSPINWIYFWRGAYRYYFPCSNFFLCEMKYLNVCWKFFRDAIMILYFRKWLKISRMGCGRSWNWRPNRLMSYRHGKRKEQVDLKKKKKDHRSRWINGKSLNVLAQSSLV